MMSEQKEKEKTEKGGKGEKEKAVFLGSNKNLNKG